MDIAFYKNIIKSYEDGNASTDQWTELYDKMFSELPKIKPDDLVPDHLEFFKLIEKHYAFIEHFEKADMVKALSGAAEGIFKARQMLADLKNLIANKNKN